MPRFKPLHAALLSVAFLGGAAGVAGWEHFSPPLAAAQAQAPAANPLLVQGLPDFSPLVDAVGPSVVNIRTMEKVTRQGVEFQGFPGMDPEMPRILPPLWPARAQHAAPATPRPPGQ